MQAYTKLTRLFSLHIATNLEEEKLWNQTSCTPLKLTFPHVLLESMSLDEYAHTYMEQTQYFNLLMATDPREGKLWIPASKKECVLYPVRIRGQGRLFSLGIATYLWERKVWIQSNSTNLKWFSYFGILQRNVFRAFSKLLYIST